jgi:HAD superfamily hydrolase (TIGR01549 family)
MAKRSDGIKAVIFDWDGTLIDSNKAIYKTYSECLKRLKLPKLSLSKFKILYESDYRRFEVKIGITPDKRKISDRIWLEFYDKQKLNLFPGIKKILMKIKNYYLLGLVTGGSLKRIKEDLRRHELDNIFDVVITGDDCSKKKPDPEPLINCIKKLGIEPKNCIYVGDMDGDIIAAKKAGMVSVAVSWGCLNGSELKKINPDCVVKSLDELEEIITKK